jgi:hypothetical protein
MTNFLSGNTGVVLLVVVVVLAVAWLVYQEWGVDTHMPTHANVVRNNAVEAFENNSPANETAAASSNDGVNMVEQNVSPAEADQESNPNMLSDVVESVDQLPSECYPKDVLNSADLLPRDANSLHAQVVPSGQGALTDQNFLTAGYHIGINTVGQTLRNANRQLRSEPPNPQVKVSPWNQTTIETDVNRRPLEIGGQ